jgi:hypothetical protein
MMAVAIRATEASFEAGVPQALFELRLSPTVLRNRWVVTRDGMRFLAAIPVEENITRNFHVIVNWTALIGKK